jgi:hypothetical protein
MSSSILDKLTNVVVLLTGEKMSVQEFSERYNSIHNSLRQAYHDNPRYNLLNELHNCGGLGLENMELFKEHCDRELAVWYDVDLMRIEQYAERNRSKTHIIVPRRFEKLEKECQDLIVRIKAHEEENEI